MIEHNENHAVLIELSNVHLAETLPNHYRLKFGTSEEQKQKD